MLLEAVREPVKVPLYRGYRCLQGPLSVNVCRVSVVEAMNMSVKAVRGLIKAVRVLIEVVGVPKEAVRVQHSHSLYNTLTTVRKFYYKRREYLLVMSNQRFFKIVCFRFPPNVPKKLNLFDFETKFIIEPKCSLSDLQIFGPKAIDLFSFQIFFEITKSFVLFLEICVLNQNVLGLFLSFWMK